MRASNHWKSLSSVAVVRPGVEVSGAIGVLAEYESARRQRSGRLAYTPVEPLQKVLVPRALMPEVSPSSP